MMKLEKLYNIILDRFTNKPRYSYVANLFTQGEDAILQKIGEEAAEVIVAGKGKSRRRIIEETADLYFMTLILLAYKKIKLNEVFEALERRRK